MNQTSKLIVSQTDRDRFARATTTVLEGKQILTPNFSPLIQTPKEFDIYLKTILSKENNEHLGTLVMRIFDASNILLPYINFKNQNGIDGKLAYGPYKEFFENTICLIDPATEYMTFEFHSEDLVQFVNKVRLPQQFITYLQQKEFTRKHSSSKAYETWKNREYKKFWYDLDQRRLNDLITGYFDLESKFETKILIPPMVVVDNERLLNIAIGINDMGKALAVNRGECATYFLLSKSTLRDATIIEKIIEYIRKDSSTLTIFKFKNLTLWETGCLMERDTFRDLMKEISDIKKDHPKRIFMLLEGSYHCFPAASYGFDIVSSSLRLLDIDSAYGTNAGYGGYFNEDNLWNVKFSALPEIILNNDGHLPCPCHVCKNITYDEVEKKILYDNKEVLPGDWNYKRRDHNLFVMNDLMKIINRAIKERQIELVRERIKNSELGNLKTLIPQHYESE